MQYIVCSMSYVVNNKSCKEWASQGTSYPPGKEKMNDRDVLQKGKKVMVGGCGEKIILSEQFVDDELCAAKYIYGQCQAK
jgi:hypothetical protein